jgi:hypothetical protein
MPIRIDDNVISLDGHCAIEEAESLHEALRAIEQPIFDVAQTITLHTAIVQLVMTSRGKVRGVPSDRVLAACFCNRLL